MGLAAIVSLISLAVALLCLLFPPWLEVECARRKNKLHIPESRQIEVYEKNFAGFDFALSRQKWTRVTEPANPVGTTIFKSSEFEIFWGLLIVEWLIVAVIAALAYYKISRRVFKTGPLENQRMGL